MLYTRGLLVIPPVAVSRLCHSWMRHLHFNTLVRWAAAWPRRVKNQFFRGGVGYGYIFISLYHDRLGAIKGESGTIILLSISSYPSWNEDGELERWENSSIRTIFWNPSTRREQFFIFVAFPNISPFGQYEISILQERVNATLALYMEILYHCRDTYQVLYYNDSKVPSRNDSILSL